jgi:dihydrodipicolinate synthase/N-acetylneuraminate lyase
MSAASTEIATLKDPAFTMTNAIRRSAGGIIPPMITPLSSPDSLDHAGLERLIEHMISGGIHGLFVLGTTGERPALSYALRRELIERTCRQVAGRILVLVGITDTSYTESLHMAEHAARCEAAAVVAAPPYYSLVQQSDLLRLIESWATECALPLHLYNFPALTKVWFDPATVERAAEMPKVVGIKDSSGDLSYVREVLKVRSRRPEFSVLVGPEHLLAESLLLGCDGGVSGGGNLFPEALVSVYEHFLAGEFDAMQSAQQRVVALGAPIFDATETDATYIGRLKCALSLVGLCSDVPVWPYRPVTAEESAAIRKHLEASGLLAGDASHERA